MEIRQSPTWTEKQKTALQKSFYYKNIICYIIISKHFAFILAASEKNNWLKDEATMKGKHYMYKYSWKKKGSFYIVFSHWVQVCDCFISNAIDLG